MPAHPRVGGENAQVTGAAFDPKGSSPRRRGKQMIKKRYDAGEGSSPRRRGKRGRLWVCRSR